MILLLLLLFVCSSNAITVGVNGDFASLAEAVAAAKTDEIVYLLGGTFDLTSTLVIERSMTLRSADGAPRSVLLSSSGDVDTIVAVGASNVVLRDLVFGRSANERAIDVFVSAGTQNQRAAIFSSSNYNGVAEPAARQPNDVTSGRDANRAIGGFVLQNVDFSRSVSASNLAFDTGAYIGARVTNCVFGIHDMTNSITSVGDALFADSEPIAFNAFDSATLALSGSGLAIGTNYWAHTEQRPVSALTYCVDRYCTLLGPIVDADHSSTDAYATIGAAQRNGVRNILLTAAEIDLHDIETIQLPGTTLSGRRPETCSRSGDEVTLIRVGSTPLTSLGSALSAVRDVRFELLESATAALSYISGDGALTSGDSVIERVSIIGSVQTSEQAAIRLANKQMSLTLSSVNIIGTGVGVDLTGGSLIVTDSVFMHNEQSSIAVGGSGSGTGLRISGSLFAAPPGKTRGSVVFAPETRSAALIEFYITCTRMIFTPLAEPIDCASNAQQCRNALRHNTFIESINAHTASVNRRFLARGDNHVEHVLPNTVSQYMQFVSGEQPHATFSMTDTQGRLARVRADVALDNSAKAEFMLATYVPMRQECFADSMPAERVVSNFFELTTDAPRRCTSLSLQFALLKPSTGNSLLVYNVEQLGNAARGGAVWQRAASHAVSKDSIEASSGGGELMRAVVIADTLTAEEQAAAITNGVGSDMTRSKRHLCVVCGDDVLPSYVVDERCGGGGVSPLFSDIDVALDAALSAAASESTSLLVYGTQCTSTQCTLAVKATKFPLTIEGLSTAQRGSIRRPASCAADQPLLQVSSPATTLRYLLLAPSKPVASAVPKCVVTLGAANNRLMFSTLSGGVCVSGASGARIVGNDIAASATAAVLVSGGSSDTLIEANAVSIGAVRIEADAKTTRIDRNTFGADARVDVGEGGAVLTSNTFSERGVDDSSYCLRAVNGSLTTTGDSFGTHCRLVLAGVGKLRVSGVHAKWRDIRVDLHNARDVRIANVDLLGPNTQIVLSGTTQDVVLYDVGVDVVESTLADTIVGFASERSQCAAANEPRLGGIAWRSSLLLDAASRAVVTVAASAKLDDSQFFSPLDGSVKSCDELADAAYCLCRAKTSTASLGKAPLPEVISVVQVVDEADLYKEQPSEEEIAQELAELKASLPKQPKAPKKQPEHAPKKQPVVLLQETVAPSSSISTGAIAILVISFGLILIVCCIGCIAFFASSSEPVGANSFSTERRRSEKREEQNTTPTTSRFGMGVVLSTSNAGASAEPSIKLRKGVTLHQE